MLGALVAVTLLATAGVEGRCLLDEVRSTDSSAYRRRGDRCEGIIPQEYAVKPGIRVLAYFYSEPEVGFAEGGRNLITVPVEQAAAQPVQIVVRTATSAGRSLNYVMDARTRGGQFIWPNELLRQKAGYARGKDFYGLACAGECSTTGDGRRLYPISITKSAALAKRYPFLLLSIPDDVREFSVTLKASGRSPITFTRSGLFGPSTPEFISLIKVPTGVYELDIVGVTRRGGRDHFAASMVVP